MTIAGLGPYRRPRSSGTGDKEDPRHWFSGRNPDLVVIRTDNDWFIEIDLVRNVGKVLWLNDDQRIEVQRWFHFHGRADDLPEILREVVIEPGPPAPDEDDKTKAVKWDSDSLTLSVGGIVCRKFTRRSNNQIKLLESLQATGWPDKPIPNPLRDESQLGQTIKDFNKSLDRPGLFHLVQDHNRVGWNVGQGSSDLP
jgi:hypothetical protein